MEASVDTMSRAAAPESSDAASLKEVACHAESCEAPQPAKFDSGMARVKPEFLKQSQPRHVEAAFVAPPDRIKSAPVDGEQPPHKKLRGQNHSRPHHRPQPQSAKLCFRHLAKEGSCPHGEQCRYSHDFQAFLSSKPADLGDKCPLVEAHGGCRYGAVCRFAEAHPGGATAAPHSVDGISGTPGECNVLSKELQQALRKRQFDFGSSTKILEEISGGAAVNGVTNGQTLNECIDDVGPEEPKKKTNQELSEKAKNARNEVDFRGKLYLAPLTTVGNLPFRRVCKEFGADITCGEMAMAANLLQGQPSEWALLKRHSSEDLFGVQLCGAHPDVMTRCAQLLKEKCSVDFVDINMGCPIDFVYKKAPVICIVYETRVTVYTPYLKVAYTVTLREIRQRYYLRGAGSGLMGRAKKLSEIVYGMVGALDVPLTVKMRAGMHEGRPIAHQVIAQLIEAPRKPALITVHPRSREQRYTKSADWAYLDRCAQAANPIPVFGSGDVLSWEDAEKRLSETSVSGLMIARGALIKPWIFTEIKEKRHWDISSSERLAILRKYTAYGLDHWGSDTEGVERTRRFLLEWLSFLHRYIPVGLLEVLPQKINERPPPYRGRDDLETLFASPSCADWLKISEMLLGPLPEGFSFLPKHKANAYSV
ncbi:dihydrouridine synthase 3 isoform X3 [Rhipicephalus microplus]|uniref:dihydrouridine synthase 3 isoform X3 n=1 Tax=Rhipicephalus microplus TaxID=6941 RepID=UPI003F6ABB84